MDPGCFYFGSGGRQEISPCSSGPRSSIALFHRALRFDRGFNIMIILSNTFCQLSRSEPFRFFAVDRRALGLCLWYPVVDVVRDERKGIGPNVRWSQIGWNQVVEIIAILCAVPFKASGTHCRCLQGPQVSRSKKGSTAEDCFDSGSLFLKIRAHENRGSFDIMGELFKRQAGDGLDLLQHSFLVVPENSAEYLPPA